MRTEGALAHVHRAKLCQDAGYSSEHLEQTLGCRRYFRFAPVPVVPAPVVVDPPGLPLCSVADSSPLR